MEISNWGANSEILNQSRNANFSPNPSHHLSYLNKSIPKSNSGGKKPVKRKRKRKLPNNSTDKKFVSKFQVTMNKTAATSKNKSFDMSGQIEDIFGEEEMEIPKELPKKKKVSWGEVTEHQSPAKVAKIDSNVPKMNSNVPILDSSVPKMDSTLPKMDSNMPKMDSVVRDFQASEDIDFGDISMQSSPKVTKITKTSKTISNVSSTVDFAKQSHNEIRPCSSKGMTPNPVKNCDKIPENPSKSGKNETCDSDIFSDSFANVLDELDKIENEKNVANRSCPKTPFYAVNSEKLELKEEEPTISDSFLEAAFKSHMSEFEAKSKVESPNSPLRSQRLMQRRKQVQLDEAQGLTVKAILVDQVNNRGPIRRRFFTLVQPTDCLFCHARPN